MPGWSIARAWFTVASEKTEWTEPFETIEAACLAIVRRLATEIADRHSMTTAAHTIRPGEPLYGLKPTTRLRKAKIGSAATACAVPCPVRVGKMRMGPFMPTTHCRNAARV